MGLCLEQIEHVGQLKSRSHRWRKNQRIRFHRRRMKQNVNYVPQFNRYKGWEY